MFAVTDKLSPVLSVPISSDLSLLYKNVNNIV